MGGSLISKDEESLINGECWKFSKGFVSGGDIRLDTGRRFILLGCFPDCCIPEVIPERAIPAVRQEN
jgi:hypothetical protein